MGDILIRSLHGDLTAVLHKIVGAERPDEVPKIDGKADTRQNGHLKETQALEYGSHCPHCAHKAQRHPEGAVAFSEGRTLMRRARYGHRQHPKKQGRDGGQRHDVEGAEHLQHEFRSLRSAKPLAPGVPPLTK